jgi:serine phosphatase RsbU (regulator of sigma subunit)
MAFLQVHQGHALGRLYPLSAGVCTLGRDTTCEIHDVFDNDQKVSRRHANIRFIDGRFVLENLSRNGTWLNGQRIDGPAALGDGDRIAICDFKFLFRNSGLLASASGSGAGLPLFVDCLPGEEVQSSVSLGTSSSMSGVSAEDRYEALLTLLSQMGGSLELTTMLDHLLEAILKIYPQADRGFVGLRTDNGCMVQAATRLRNAKDTRPVVISRRIVERVVQSCEAILLADALGQSSDDSQGSIADAQIRSVICAPLLDVDGSVLGILQVDSLWPGKRFVPEDLERLVALAPQAAFAVRVGQLHRQSLKQAAIERDLQLASQVQASLLPSHPPVVEGYEFFAHYKSARHVGGDYYDFVPLTGKRIAVILADVAGKGVSAALEMAELRGELSHLLQHETVPTAVLQQFNTGLIRRSAVGRFVTMILAIVDTASHKVAIINAGHMSPLHRDARRRVTTVGDSQRGMALGFDPHQTYQEHQMTLDPGEALVLYTDGMTDAQNPSEAWYGDPRLRETLQAAPCGAEAIGRFILNDIAQFVQQMEQTDDMCLLCVHRKG